MAGDSHEGQNNYNKLFRKWKKQTNKKRRVLEKDLFLIQKTIENHSFLKKQQQQNNMKQQKTHKTPFSYFLITF